MADLANKVGAPRHDGTGSRDRQHVRLAAGERAHAGDAVDRCRRRMRPVRLEALPAEPTVAATPSHHRAISKQGSRDLRARDDGRGVRDARHDDR